MVRHFPILENSETELSVDPRNGRRNNTTRSALTQALFGCVGGYVARAGLLFAVWVFIYSYYLLILYAVDNYVG